MSAVKKNVTLNPSDTKRKKKILWITTSKFAIYQNLHKNQKNPQGAVTTVKLSIKKSLSPDGYTRKFYQHLVRQ